MGLPARKRWSNFTLHFLSDFIIVMWFSPYILLEVRRSRSRRLGALREIIGSIDTMLFLTASHIHY